MPVWQWGKALSVPAQGQPCRGCSAGDVQARGQCQVEGWTSVPVQQWGKAMPVPAQGPLSDADSCRRCLARGSRTGGCRAGQQPMPETQEQCHASACLGFPMYRMLIAVLQLWACVTQFEDCNYLRQAFAVPVVPALHFSGLLFA
mmetsp:Transcript_50471/g.109594  ORF Transcript_50471/g.109594 Transcript_50471/m.109594 type:complete len:145 (-) Transcript_50471:153-587(-)